MCKERSPVRIVEPLKLMTENEGIVVEPLSAGFRYVACIHTIQEAINVMPPVWRIALLL